MPNCPEPRTSSGKIWYTLFMSWEKRRTAYLHAIQMTVAPKKGYRPLPRGKTVAATASDGGEVTFLPDFRLTPASFWTASRRGNFSGAKRIMFRYTSCTTANELRSVHGPWGRGCLMTEKSLLEQRSSRSEGAASLRRLIFSCATGEDVSRSYWIFRWLRGTRRDTLIVLSEILLLPSCVERVVNFFSWQANKRRQLQQLRGCQ